MSLTHEFKLNKQVFELAVFNLYYIILMIRLNDLQALSGQWCPAGFSINQTQSSKEYLLLKSTYYYKFIVTGVRSRRYLKL